MAVMDITTNIGCPVNCVYCLQELVMRSYGKTGGPLMMPFDTFKRCIDKIPQDVIISFAGMSEPWANPECTKMLLYAYDKGHKIEVSTTLTCESLEDLDRIKHIPFHLFRVHVPSNDPDERIRPDESYLGRIKKVLETDIGARFHYHGPELHESLRPFIADAERVLIASRSVNDVPKREGTAPIRRLFAIACSLGLRFNELLPNGDVYLCCEDYGLKHKLGNLLEADYGDLFKSGEYFKVKRGLKDMSVDILCRNCCFAYNTVFLGKLHNNIFESGNRSEDLYDFVKAIGKAAGRYKNYIVKKSFAGRH